MLFFELFPAFMTIVCGAVAIALVAAHLQRND